MIDDLAMMLKRLIAVRVYENSVYLEDDPEKSAAEMADDFARKLWADNPSWQELYWSYEMEEYHKGRGILKITIRDLNKTDDKWVGVFCLALFFIFAIATIIIFSEG